MYRRVAASFLFLLAAAPAWGGDKLTMQVSATILARNTCALDVETGLRCSGTDDKVLYRASGAGTAAPVLASVARGKVQRLSTPRGDVLTVEF